MRTFWGPSSLRIQKERKPPQVLTWSTLSHSQKINPRSNIDLALINSQGCSYEMKKQKPQKPSAQHTYSPDRRGVFNTLVWVDNKNEEGEWGTEDRRQIRQTEREREWGIRGSQTQRKNQASVIFFTSASTKGSARVSVMEISSPKSVHESLCWCPYASQFLVTASTIRLASREQVCMHWKFIFTHICTICP